MGGWGNGRVRTAEWRAASGKKRKTRQGRGEPRREESTPGFQKPIKYKVPA